MADLNRYLFTFKRISSEVNHKIPFTIPPSWVGEGLGGGERVKLPLKITFPSRCEGKFLRESTYFSSPEGNCLLEMKKLVSSHLWRNWPNSPSDCRSQAGKEDQRVLQQKKLKKIVLSWTGIRNWEYLSGRSLGSSSAIANSAPLVLRRCTRTSSYLLH